VVLPNKEPVRVAAAIDRVVRDPHSPVDAGPGRFGAGRRPSPCPGCVTDSPPPSRQPAPRDAATVPGRRSTMKVAFVVPRYGPTIIGGAETAARALAEHLVARKGWEVRCSPAVPRTSSPGTRCSPGDEVINGVRVTRFTSQRGRDPSFHPFSASLLADPSSASLGERRAVGRSAGTGGPRSGGGSPRHGPMR
jgi:hypothetical protein